MKCKNCGTVLLDTDQFCANCGQKVIKERRCPECGTRLRDGMKFCHECGCLVGTLTEERSTAKITAETIDIPIADIEKNILLETEHELGTTIRKLEQKKKAVKAPVKPKPVLAEQEERIPAPEKRKKKKICEPVQERIWEEEVYEEEEENEENEHNIMTIVIVVMGFLIFSIAAFLIFNLVRNQPVRNYGNSTEKVQEAEDDSAEDNRADISSDTAAAGILTIDSNVNVRDNPGTEGTNIIKVAKAGEMYQYSGQTQDGEWYMIVLEDGSTGYVYKDYISVK